jgi:cell division protein ZapB
MTELEHLEQKLAQLVAMHKQVREENRDLRLRAAQLDADNKKLADKVASARTRVEALLARVPAEG